MWLQMKPSIGSNDKFNGQVVSVYRLYANNLAFLVFGFCSRCGSNWMLLLWFVFNYDSLELVNSSVGE